MDIQNVYTFFYLSVYIKRKSDWLDKWMHLRFHYSIISELWKSGSDKLCALELC